MKYLVELYCFKKLISWCPRKHGYVHSFEKWRIQHFYQIWLCEIQKYDAKNFHIYRVIL